MSGPDAESSVDRLIAEYLAARDAGTAPPADEWARAHPAHEAELRAFLTDALALDARLDPLLDPEAGGFVRPGQRFGSFTAVRLLATGGMGTVWAAEQDGLRRCVALKLLNAASAPREAVERFRREAEAMAALDHQHIVPIYKVGEQDGVPYFAMKLAACDLRDRLSAYRADPRAAAVLLAKVARAVHHAHLHGVLHRDLKPANILLDDPADGGPAEPLVADFGLAKFGNATSADAPTRTGEVLGTPGYMSPEQAAGRGNRGTVLTDVYGLGAVLYAVLTGAPPFAGASDFETVRKVLADEPERPSARFPGTDPDLETVCLRCLEKSPERRYKSAAAVADELDRWLRGEPIRARPVCVWSRARRWVRRNPYPAALLAAGALLVLVAAVAAVVTRALNERLGERNESLNRANAELVAANAKLAAALVETDRARADAVVARELEAQNSALAREAVAGYDRLGDAPELNGPGGQPVRRLMFLEALKYYERFAAQNGTDGPLARDVIDARLKAANLCSLLDRGDEALAHAAVAAEDEALAHAAVAAELAAARLRAHPADSASRYQLACAHSARGLMLKRRKGDTAGALAAWRECARAAGPLLATSADAAALVSEAHRNVGRALFDSDPTAARAAFAEARACAELALRVGRQRPPDGYTPQTWFGGREVVLGVDTVEAQLEAEAGNFARAEARFAAVVAGWRAVLAESRRQRAEERLAEALRQYGVVMYQSGNGDPFPLLHEARKRYELIARTNPAVPRHALDAANCRMSLGNAHLQIGEPEAAVAHFDAALAGFARPDGKFDPEYKRFAMFALLGRGRAHAHLRRFAQAEQDFRQALAADPATGMVTSLFVVEAVCLQGFHAAAAKKLDTLTVPNDPRATPLWVELALGWVRCAAAAERDRKLDDAERERLISEYRGKAAAALRRVPDWDNDRIRRMTAQPDFWMHDLGPLPPPASVSRTGN
jgi:tetratricopeptide (TPR) repeat protein